MTLKDSVLYSITHVSSMLMKRMQ